MKIHIAMPGAVGDALRQTLSLSSFSVDHPDRRTADVVIVGSIEDAVRHYTHHQYFILTTIHDPRASLPKNAIWIQTTRIMDTVGCFRAWDQAIGDGSVCLGLEMGKKYAPKSGVTAESWDILVVDDTIANLALAVEQLGNDHYVTLALGYGEAQALIAHERYGIVLCDCNMPNAGIGGALSALAATDIGVTVPCGPYLIFPATQSGADIAIVTDANHHKDWTSALFDTLQGPQIVNGKKVRFINSIGKDWGKALKILLGTP